jgi:WD40 repeat protein
VHLPDGSTREINVSDNIGPLDIAPDGTVLLYDAALGRDSTSGGAWVQRSRDSAPAWLGHGIPFAFSPDFTKALILEHGPPQQITVMPLGVGDPRQVPLAPGLVYRSGRFFPDGKRLLFAAARPGETLRYGWQAIDENEFHPLAEATHFSAYSLSPDGRMIAAIARDGAIRLTPVDAGAARELPAPFVDHRGVVRNWSPDGRVIYAVHGSSLQEPFAEVRAVDVATGKSETYLKIDVPPGFSSVPGMVISGDGQAWAFGRYWATSRLMLAENLP